MIRRPIQSLRRLMLDRMVLRPSREPLDGGPQERVMLSAGRLTLECFVQRNFQVDQVPELLVLKFPGTAGRAERSTSFPMSVADDLRVEMWTWNPPGYGGSPGRARLASIADAAVEFSSAVTTRVAGPPTTVWLCGNSLGCATAIYVAAHMQHEATSTGLILRNVPPLRSVVRRVARSYPLGSLADPVIESLPQAMDVTQTAPKVCLPAVFLQSEFDTLVPVSDQNKVVQQYGGPSRVVLLRGIDHSGLTTEEHEPVINEATRWLWNQTECRTHESFQSS